MKKAFIILASVSAACVIALGILTGCFVQVDSGLKGLKCSVNLVKCNITSSIDAATERIATLETTDAANTQKIADLESENSTNKQKLASLETQLAACRMQISKLEQANEDKDDEIYLLQEQCESIQNEINKINALISSGSV